MVNSGYPRQVEKRVHIKEDYSQAEDSQIVAKSLVDMEGTIVLPCSKGRKMKIESIWTQEREEK